MRRFPLFLLVIQLALLAGTGMAWADGQGQTDKSNPAGTPQQRRAALRAELRAQREAAPQKDDRPARQLTPTEREKLREQLRQQRKEALQQRQSSGN